MNQKFNIPYRIIALFIALSMLPALLFSGHDLKNTEKDHAGPFSESILSAEYDINQYPAAFITEELFRDHTARISQNHPQKRSGRSDTFQVCLISNFLLTAAAYILFILIKLWHENKNFSLKFIIRYIHDQDGYKIYDLIY